MNFLELCQFTIKWSGTGSKGTVDTVTTDRQFPSKVVDFVQESWREIQQERKSWRFMRKTVTFRTRVNQDTYEWKRLTHHQSNNLLIPRFRRWITNGVIWYLEDPDKTRRTHQHVPSVFDEDGGTLGRICEIDYEFWRELYVRQYQTARKPIEFAISPSDQILLGPRPDKVYEIQAAYQAGVHVLKGNDDIPADLPEDYHAIIGWRAVLMLNEYDTDAVGGAWAGKQYEKMLNSLMATQLPPMRLAESAF